jgi:hypothetical protein
MTIFTPEWRVKVNGSTVTNVTLADLFITAGRQSIYEQAGASYCSLNLIADPSYSVSFDVNDAVTVEVKNTSGTYVNLFGGYLSDVNVVVTSPGSTLIAQQIRLTAIGSLARLVRANFTGNLASDMDGNQIYALLEDLLLGSWNEVPAALTWDTYDPTETWANAQNTGLGQIDRPGDFELEAQNNLNGSVYQYAAGVATSGLGYLYEDAQGRICYADSTHRGEALATSGYVDLDANHSFGSGLEIAKRAGDVRNKVSIVYGSSGNASVTDEELDSISLYGELASTINTTIKGQTDAENQAAFYLSLRAFPQFQFKNISFPLGNPEMDNQDRDALLGVNMGMAVNIQNLPANMNNGEFQGFVEGWTWRAGVSSLTLEMIVSPLAYSLQAFRWNNVPATETWNTISPTLDWLNATIVA